MPPPPLVVSRRRRPPADLAARLRGDLVVGGLVRPGDRVMIGVSGGLDSVALLHLLLQAAPSLRLTLAVAHVHHGLRPEADADAAFVERLARRWRVPSTVLRCEVRRLVEAQGRSVEDAARRLRYAALEAAASRWSAHHVAVAHTADDQAETVLMRLIRGAGLTGLAGMPMQRPLGQAVLIRPLLGVWRRELSAYVRRHGLPFREDASNRDTTFLRNRVRRELLPRLERDYNPAIKTLLLQLAEHSREEVGYVQEMVRRSWRRFVAPAAGGLLLRSAALRRQPQAVQRAVIRGALIQLQGALTGFEFRHWRGIERLLGEALAGSVVELPSGIRLERGAGGVLMSVRRRGIAPSTAALQDGEFAVY